jgi:UPF0716 protein FxsA
MFRRLILPFIVVPIAELALLIQLGRWIGLWPTLGLIVVTGTVGAVLAAREGLRALHALQVDLAEGRIPGRPILDGLSIFVGGALLLTPGLMTDLLGFALPALAARPDSQPVRRRAAETRPGLCAQLGRMGRTRRSGQPGG